MSFGNCKIKTMKGALKPQRFILKCDDHSGAMAPHLKMTVSTSVCEITMGETMDNL